MKTGKFYGLAAVAALASTLTSTAFATESGVYLGVNVGNSKFDVGSTDVQLFDITLSSSQDDKDTGFSVAVGYRFNPYLGLEASYVDFGEATFSESGQLIGLPITFNASAAVSVKGPVAAATASLPIGNFELGMKLGAMFAKTEIAVDVSGGGQSASDSVSDSTTETLVSLGAGYTFGNHFHVRLDFTRVPDAGDENETGEGDVTWWSAGFQYRF